MLFGFLIPFSGVVATVGVAFILLGLAFDKPPKGFLAAIGAFIQSLYLQFWGFILLVVWALVRAYADYGAGKLF